MNLSSNLGLIKWQTNCKLKLSYNYEQNGSWGDAIECAKKVVKFSSNRRWKGLQFVSLLQVFNMYTLVNSPKAKIYRDRCKIFINQIESKSDLALYYYQLGNYLVTSEKYKKAINSYKKAEKYYLDIQFGDDAIRCALKIAYAYLLSGFDNKCKKKLDKIQVLIKNMESEDLFNEYFILQLSYYYLMKTQKKKMNNLTLECESRIKKINNIKIYIDMSKILFRIYSRAGNKKKGIFYYKCYHRKLSLIVNQLDNKSYSGSYIQNSDYSTIRFEAKLLNNKNRSVRGTDLS